ncbi:MAG TPA: polyphosphate kinase 2 family protein [Candidatus Polarisedimenticolaceae bacterium]|nr:polyphosphate kinase 2 family protein [Candidatus Polarisedimenticolaceae bacterium]
MKSLARRYRVEDGARFRLGQVDPGETAGIASKREAQRLLERGIERLCAAQPRLYAQDRWALLLIFQALDAAGKDGTIAHVMRGVDPQGCQVFAFKAPSPEELDHDFLWRTTRCLPERGRIGIFNRSYYEEVLVVRVHPELLVPQRLPQARASGRLWRERFEDINAFERHLVRNGTAVLKFFLHISRDEQRRRFLERLDEPDKHWKFRLADVAERRHWTAYQHAYEEAIRQTATRASPWYVVPGDHKWFTRLVVAEIIGDALERLAPDYPALSRERRRELAAARALLRE